VNFLQLCQKTAQESGTLAGLPSFTTVNTPSGRLAKIIAWVRDAWVNIQNERTDWLFRLDTFDHALTIGTNEYTGASFDLALAQWLPDTATRCTMSLYDPAIGQADEGGIQQIPWNRFRDMFDRGVTDPNRPRYWAVKPNGALMVGPTPDKAYVLRGEYKRSAQQLAADADIPIMPEDFHGLIVGEALRLMANSDESFEGLASRAAEYEKLRNPLVLDQTPAASLAGVPLA
jgi:hypothetical protein